MTNDLAQHEETVQTLEEIKAEKRLVLKVDLMIPPILIITFGIAPDRMKKAGRFAIASFPIASIGSSSYEQSQVG
jgi:hypothetical protein